MSIAQRCTLMTFFHQCHRLKPTVKVSLSICSNYMVRSAPDHSVLNKYRSVALFSAFNLTALCTPSSCLLPVFQQCLIIMHIKTRILTLFYTEYVDTHHAPHTVPVCIREGLAIIGSVDNNLGCATVSLSPFFYVPGEQQYVKTFGQSCHEVTACRLYCCPSQQDVNMSSLSCPFQ